VYGVVFASAFNRKKVINKSGHYSIHIRVTIDRETNYLNPKLTKIEPKFWSGKQNKWVRESHPNSFEINSLLQRKLAELDYHPALANSFGLKTASSQLPFLTQSQLLLVVKLLGQLSNKFGEVISYVPALLFWRCMIK
jgi:hypothetical protein